MRRRDRHPLRCGLSVGATVVFLMGCGSTPDSVPASPSGASAGNPIAGATGPGAGTDPKGAVQPVRLDDMDTERSDPTPEQRNPFRFGGGGPPASFNPAPVLPPLPSRGGALDLDAAPAPLSGAPTTAIPLTFIGFMESPGIEGRVVVLTDGDDVFHGRRVDVIDGRYRIVRLDLESVELERIDGGGQATLRLPKDVSDGV
ncbi:MAG TPA: hypothetical protein EYQ83_05700 [Acidobacteria bacterium]|nr:hypothetical protein [Acidobacteriota bacterium]